ncbi:hypothetical protein KPH14_006436 [Odynerus spinipes]|uniref:RIIa domain-containing protein n=1 Tax=Odynerus spinipes TaxID=1348599 RepID=A0AAD9RQF2_9HYME|nr:hypothetical protein KPH14_006436 [Odynerus spinipes]
MDVTLEKHGAKHVYRVPDGLRELCTDITREVLRSQPAEIYHFIADYIDVLLITRENAKVAVKVVNNILRGSQTIMSILYRTGLNIEQIAAAAPRIQRAFRAYLDIADGRQEPCENEFDEKSILSLRDILETTGIDYKQAEKAATIIQSAFRGHHARMMVAESQGKVQWQRALINTLDILRKAGVSKEEITRSLPIIQTAYRSYYTQKNIKIQTSAHPKKEEAAKKKPGTTVEPGQTIQAVAWLEMIYEDSGLNVEVVNTAALIIQRAYKRYRQRKGFVRVQRVVSSRTLIVDAILNSLHQRVFHKVTSRDDIPEKLGTREDMKKASKTLQQVYKDHLRRSRISMEGEDEKEMTGINSGEMDTLEEMVEEEGKVEETKAEEKVETDQRVSGTEGTLTTGDEETPVEDPAGEPINVEETHTIEEEREVEQDEHKEQEEQEMSQETTPTSDTAG